MDFIYRRRQQRQLAALKPHARAFSSPSALLFFSSSPSVLILSRPPSIRFSPVASSNWATTHYLLLNIQTFLLRILRHLLLLLVYFLGFSFLSSPRPFCSSTFRFLVLVFFTFPTQVTLLAFEETFYLLFFMCFYAMLSEINDVRR